MEAERRVSRTANRAPRRVTVVGAGIAGLAAAWELEIQRRSGVPLDWRVLESESRAGGKIWTERVDGCLIERGADSFVADKPGARELIQELGLEGELLGIEPRATRVFIARGDRLIPLPRDMFLAVPIRLGPFLRSPLLSLSGRFRVLLEPFTRVPDAPGDESLAEFITRHLGREALQRIAEPLMAGIHLADPERLSMNAAFPALVAMERRYGSLLWAARATARRTGRRPLARRMALRSGMSELVDKLLARLPGGSVNLDRRVEAIERTDTGWRLRIADAPAVETDGLVLALPAPLAADLLEPTSPRIAHELDQIHYASSANLTLAFDEDHFERPLTGSGFLVPRSERRTITACTFVSSKFPNRAPTGITLLRVFFGGARDPEAVQRPDDELLAAARADLEALLGIRAEPRFARLARFSLGTPQYAVGHLDRVAAIERGAPPDLAIAGSALHGVGLPECVVSGREAARRVLEA